MFGLSSETKTIIWPGRSELSSDENIDENNGAKNELLVVDSTRDRIYKSTPSRISFEHFQMCPMEGEGSMMAPKNVFDHCAQTLRSRKLKLGDF